MSFKIEPYDLQVDEILFELEIRFMASDMTKHGIDLLRKRLDFESQGKILRPRRQGIYDVSEEIKNCIEKNDDLETHLTLAALQPDRPDKVLILISRFCHVHFRLKMVVSKDKREQEQIKILLEKISGYLSLLDSVRQGNSNLEEALNLEDFFPETSTISSASDLTQMGLIDLFSIEEDIVSDELDLSLSDEKLQNRNECKQTFFPPYKTYSGNQTFKARMDLALMDYVFINSVKDCEKAVGSKFESAPARVKTEIGEFGMLKYLRKCLE